MFTPGPWELIIILAVVMIIFGPGKLPGIGKDLGKGIRTFKKAIGQDGDAENLPTSGAKEEEGQKSDSSKGSP